MPPEVWPSYWGRGRLIDNGDSLDSGPIEEPPLLSSGRIPEVLVPSGGPLVHQFEIVGACPPLASDVGRA